MDASSTSQHGGIQLTVTPTSSAFFSGETLEFTITFRNTRPRYSVATSTRPSSSSFLPPLSTQLPSQAASYPSTPAAPRPYANTSSVAGLSASASANANASPSAPSTSHPGFSHTKHLSTSSLNVNNGYPSAATSAPASHSGFPLSPYRPNHTPSTSVASRSFADLSTFASTDNRLGSSTHIILPERKGIIGTPLALTSSSSQSVSTPNSSPKHYLRGAANAISTSSSPQSTTNSRVTNPHSSLYSSKRIPHTRHKKNDYSIAGPSARRDNGEELLDSSLDDPNGGVSDLSSQLAGMALLQEREGDSLEGDADAMVDAQPFVDQYKRNGDMLFNRFPSSTSSGPMRTPSGFSAISEEESPHLSPPDSKRSPHPRRSMSYNSALHSESSTRVPSSSSAFRHLDDANEYHSPQTSQSGFYATGRNESVDSILRDSVNEYMRPSTLQRNTSSGRHYPPNLQTNRAPHHGRSLSAANTPQSGTAPWRLLTPNSAISDESGITADDNGLETLLWTFAQFSGNFTVEDALVKPAEFLAVKKALFGGTRMEYAIGGGSLDTEAAQPSPYSGTMSGKLASWIWGTSKSDSIVQEASSQTSRSRESTGSSLQLPTDPALDPARRKSSSATAVQGPFANSVHALGSLEERRNRAMNDKNYPVFSSPPSILAVDLTLEPGESKTYTFSLQLPGDLPPSYRGKAISFQYTLMVGTNRAPNRSLGEYKQHSRLIRIPVRIYNHVSVTGVRPFYDLTNPIIWSQDEAKISSEDDKITENDLLHMSRTSRRKQRQRSSSIENAYAAARKSEQRKDFQDYAGRLLDACAEAAAAVTGGGSPKRSPSLPPPMEKDDGKAYDDGGPAARPELMQRTSSSTSYALANGGLLGQDGEDTSCKGAVEIVSRNAQKVSYDINKDGYRIATVTLVKSAYRLGDTVNVMISINEGAARVLRIAARLETHELIETTVSVKSANQVRQLTRRLHAEHHETTLDSGRAGFALAIPSGATPDFATSAVKLQWSLRVALLIIPPQAPRNIPGMSAYPSAYPKTGSSTPGIPSPLPSSSAASSTSSLPLSSPSQSQSNSRSNRSYPFPGSSNSSIPASGQAELASHHLLPLPSIHPHQQYTSYRAVADLSFLPTLFQSPDSQQQQSQNTGKRILSGNGIEQDGPTSPGGGVGAGETVVLMPTKIETVEVTIPLRVYPSATPFRPHVSAFAV